jgi:hypothetical protein
MDASPIPAKNEIGVENDEIVDAYLRNFIITQYPCTCFSICSAPDINEIRSSLTKAEEVLLVPEKFLHAAAEFPATFLHFTVNFLPP